MDPRSTLLIRTVEARDDEFGVVVHGVVGIGPVADGDSFIAASEWDHAEPVCLRLTQLDEPSEAQEIGRTARVVAVLTGEGAELLRPGMVLLGDVSVPHRERD